MPYTYLILCQTEDSWNGLLLVGEGEISMEAFATSEFKAVELLQEVPEALDYTYFTPLSYTRPDGRSHKIKKQTTWKVGEDMVIRKEKESYVLVKRPGRSEVNGLD